MTNVESLPVLRRMSRCTRIGFEGAVCRLTARGGRRREVCRDDQDRRLVFAYIRLFWHSIQARSRSDRDFGGA